MYLTMFIIVLEIFFVVFSDQFQQYFIGYTQDMMIHHAKVIAEEYAELALLHQTPLDTLNQIAFKVETLDTYLNSTTLIIDAQNRVSIISENVQTKLTEDQVLYDEAIDQVFAGNVVKIDSGFEEYFSTSVLTIGYPIWVFNNIEYALFVHTPLPHILEITQDIDHLTVQVILLIGIGIFLAIFFLSRQLTTPLVAMNNLAKKIANGEFDKRIPIKSKDEIGQLASSFNHMASELDKIEENRKSFLANVSHDMRSPLTSIQGFVTAILDETIPADKQGKYLNIVLDETRRLIKMTNDILELNRLEAGNLPLHRIIFDINAVIKQVLSHFDVLIYEKNIRVNLKLEGVTQEVMADLDQLMRVIQNLLDNAFKFVDRNGVIEVETISVGDKLWVYIKNSGENIPTAELSNIWDRFYKTDLSRGKDKQGMGIGLVIVKEIIKQHQEKIGVTSHKGDMTSFYFSIERVKKSKKRN